MSADTVPSNASVMQLKYTHLPKCPGVYIMKNANGEVIYVGKASSLKMRVSSYFQKVHDVKTELLVRDIAAIDYEQTNSVLEATFREAELIKKYQPKYNIEQKDDKSFIHLAVTNDEFPKVLMVRGRELEKGDRNYLAIFGPFTSAELLRSLLRIVRKIIPYSNCASPFLRHIKGCRKPAFIKISACKPCFYYHIGQCPGICTGEIRVQEYRKIIRNLILFFQGKKKRVAANLKKEMIQLGKQERFEEATKIRNQLFNLDHIQDTALLKRDEEPSASALFHRIEGYDISHISGTNATGSMVVFENGVPSKAEYRKFKIKSVSGANDTAMLKEVLNRRFQHNWPHPDLILIDGGIPQVNVAKMVLDGLQLKIPIVGIAKGPSRKKNELIIKHLTQTLREKTTTIHNLLVCVRDEAHRFAVAYHHILAK